MPRCCASPRDRGRAVAVAVDRPPASAPERSAARASPEARSRHREAVAALADEPGHGRDVGPYSRRRESRPILRWCVAGQRSSGIAPRRAVGASECGAALVSKSRGSRASASRSRRRFGTRCSAPSLARRARSPHAILRAERFAAARARDRASARPTSKVPRPGSSAAGHGAAHRRRRRRVPRPGAPRGRSRGRPAACADRRRARAATGGGSGSWLAEFVDVRPVPTPLASPPSPARARRRAHSRASWLQAERSRQVQSRSATQQLPRAARAPACREPRNERHRRILPALGAPRHRMRLAV
jgi:hypothetical protein